MSTGNEHCVLVIDDDVQFVADVVTAFRRFAVKHQIEADVLGATSWTEAVSLLQQYEIDTVLLDYHLDSENVLDLIPLLKQTYRVETVVVMSDRATFEEGGLSIIAGASTCVVKRDVISIIKATYRHLRLPRKRPDNLTARERELMGLLAQKLTNRTIAKIMGISIHTVNAHLRNLYAKLKISERRELIKIAQQFSN